MAGIILPHRFSQQPQYAAPLDTEGLGKGFQLLINPALGPVDLVTGRVWSPGGNAYISSGTHGRSLDFDGVDDYYTYTGYPEISGNVGSVVFWCPRVGVADTFGHILLSDNGGIYLQVASLSSVFFGGTANASGSIPSWFSTSNRCLVFSSDGTAAGTKLFLDGVDTGMAWSSPPGSHSASSKTFNIGNYTGGASWDFDGSMLVMGKTTQVWRANEAKAFYDSKGRALFQAPQRRFWSAPAASGSGVGSSSGIAAVAGIGASLSSQPGSSLAVAAVSGIGVSINAQPGSSAGIAAVSGVGASLFAGVGASNGIAAASGVGSSIAAGSAVGAAAGIASVSGIGASIAASVGASGASASAIGISSFTGSPDQTFSGGYLYRSREEREAYTRKQRIALGIIEEEKPVELAKYDEILKPKKQKKVDREAQLKAEIKYYLDLELQREEEAIVRLLMEM